MVNECNRVIGLEGTRVDNLVNRAVACMKFAPIIQLNFQELSCSSCAGDAKMLAWPSEVD